MQMSALSGFNQDLFQRNYVGCLSLVGAEHLGINLRVLDIAMREHLCDSIDGTPADDRSVA